MPNCRLKGGPDVIDRLLSVPHGEVFARIWEPGFQTQDSPIVLLHDSLGCVDLWRSFPGALAAATGRTVIAYDRLGFGRSTARTELPSNNFIAEEAEIYFPHLRDQLGLSNYVLFGHSVGGAMAVAIASRSLNACLAVVTESAQAFVEDNTIRGIQAAKEKFAKNPAALEKLKGLHGDKTDWVVRAWIDVWLRPEFAVWNLEADLAKVTRPMLIMHGDRDEFGSVRFPETFRDHTAADSQMEIIKDCGHVPHREHPEIVLSLTSNFLTELQHAA